MNKGDGGLHCGIVGYGVCDYQGSRHIWLDSVFHGCHYHLSLVPLKSVVSFDCPWTMKMNFGMRFEAVEEIERLDDQWARYKV